MLVALINDIDYSQRAELTGKLGLKRIKSFAAQEVNLKD